MAARKKTTTTVEEELPEEIDYKKDIEGKSIEEVALDITDELVEEPVVEETPAESDTEEIEFDPEAFKRETIESATAEAEKRLLEKLKGDTPQETAENRDEYQEWAEQFSQTHGGAAPEWKDAFKWMEDKAVDKLEQRQAAKAEEAAKAQVAAQTEEAAKMDNVNKYVDNQMEDLYASNKFPKIQNKEDANDRGVLFRKSLMEQTMLINKDRIEKGLPTKTIKEVFYEDFKSPTSQPAGADAPVSGARGGTAAEDGEELNYMKDVRNNRLLNSIFKRRS